MSLNLSRDFRQGEERLIRDDLATECPQQNRRGFVAADEQPEGGLTAICTEDIEVRYLLQYLVKLLLVQDNAEFHEFLRLALLELSAEPSTRGDKRILDIGAAPWLQLDPSTIILALVLLSIVPMERPAVEEPRVVEEPCICPGLPRRLLGKLDHKNPALAERVLKISLDVIPAALGADLLSKPPADSLQVANASAAGTSHSELFRAYSNLKVLCCNTLPGAATQRQPQLHSACEVHP
mmetsp:Transcript_53457/g.148119  ORF Transcript_53457/g.148119 Transcript_53457/m.148119 type:complete len:238 (-) Transcript_53457:160-873(-)